MVSAFRSFISNANSPSLKYKVLNNFKNKTLHMIHYICKYHISKFHNSYLKYLTISIKVRKHKNKKQEIKIKIVQESGRVIRKQNIGNVKKITDVDFKICKKKNTTDVHLQNSTFVLTFVEIRFGYDYELQQFSSLYYGTRNCHETS